MRPRGSRNATFDSFDVALNDLRASANDSALFLPRVETRADWPGSLLAELDVAAVGLKMPVHNFGVVQAFGGGEATLMLSVPVSSDADVAMLPPSCSKSGTDACWGCELSDNFSAAGFEVSRGRVLGMAGTIGTGGTIGLWEAFGAIGVASPGAGID